MPVISNSLETELKTRHWLSKTITERPQLQETAGLRQPATLSTCLKPKEDLQRLAGLDHLNRLTKIRKSPALAET